MSMDCQYVFNCFDLGALAPYWLATLQNLLKPYFNFLAFGLPGADQRKYEAEEATLELKRLLQEIDTLLENDEEDAGIWQQIAQVFQKKTANAFCDQRVPRFGQVIVLGDTWWINVLEQSHNSLSYQPEGQSRIGSCVELCDVRDTGDSFVSKELTIKRLQFQIRLEGQEETVWCDQHFTADPFCHGGISGWSAYASLGFAPPYLDVPESLPSLLAKIAKFCSITRTGFESTVLLGMLKNSLLYQDGRDPDISSPDLNVPSFLVRMSTREMKDRASKFVNFVRQEMVDGQPSDSVQDSFLQKHANKSILTMLKDEYTSSKFSLAARTGYIMLAMYTAYSDVKNVLGIVSEAPTLFLGIGQSLIILSRSSNMAALMSVIGAHAIFDDIQTARNPILGDFYTYYRSCWDQAYKGCPQFLDWDGDFLRGAPPRHRMIRGIVIASFMLNGAMLYGITIGAALSGWHWRQEALKKMPWTQQIFVKILWVAYKPIYHLLMILAIPAYIAYAPITMFVILFLVMLAGCQVKCLLPRVLMLRPCGDPIEKRILLDHVRAHSPSWYIYLLGPLACLFYVTFMVPVALRFYSGLGWWGALYATWQERTVAGYFEHLKHSVEQKIAFMWQTL